MPTTGQILALLASTAQSWQHASAFWHLYLGAFIAALVFGARPPARFCGLFLAPPILGVGAAAWMSGNPFNGVIFSLLGAAVALMSLNLPKAAVRLSSAGARLAGIVLLTFGWIYPHFLETSSWLTYLHAAPVGVIPCATLSAVIGLTLILNGLGSRRLALTLGIVGTVYGATGVLQLGVIIDLILLAGAAALLVLGIRGRLCLRGRSLAAAPAGGDHRERSVMTAWGVGPRLSGITLTYAALAAFVRFAADDLGLPAWPATAAFVPAGAGLVVASAALWMLGVRRVDRAFAERRLLTTGIHSLVRHPMYSALVVFLPLGAALMLRSWAFLTVPVAASLSFFSLIRDEEAYLEREFGRSYADFKQRVGALVPFLRWPGSHRRNSSSTTK